jgi:hypothetical protein
MSRNVSSHIGSLSISAASSSFAIAAATQGMLGVLIGAAVVILITLITADGLFWPLALWALIHRQPNRGRTLSSEEATQEAAAWRQTLLELARAQVSTAMRKPWWVDMR